MIRKDAHWVSLDLSKSYIKTCKSVLATLESPEGSRIRPENCFNLWSRLGRLRQDEWSELTSSEKSQLASDTQDLTSRLINLLNSRRHEILESLGVGVQKIAKRAGRSLMWARWDMRIGPLGSTLTSLEFDESVLYRRDNIGFAFLLLAELHEDLPSSAQKKLGRLDDALKSVLPEIRRR